MALKTYSKFYYGFKISPSNYTLDFKEDGGLEKQASLTLTDYTLTSIVEEVERVLNATGDKTYIVTVNRDDRKITISCDAGVFSLLPVSGSRASASVLPLIGFTTDQIGVSSVTSFNGAGYEYAPQFWLQDFVPSENWSTSIDAVVNRSSSGKVEVVKFGKESFTEFNIKFITECPQPLGKVRNDLSALTKLRAFLNFCTDKGYVEFMRDENNVDIYESLLLESTPFDSKGTGYKLTELTSKGLPEYFDTGILKFKVIEV